MRFKTATPQEVSMAFEKALRQIAESAELIVNPSPEELREMSLKEAKKTAYGSLCYFTKIKGRSAKKTEIVEGEPTEEQMRIVSSLPKFVKGKGLIQLDRQMCVTKPFHCRAYVSMAYAHIAYMWGEMLFMEIR